jgi:hypothetical protein
LVSRTGALRDPNREFGKHLKVIGVEGVDSLNAVGLHSRRDLQVEYISSCDGAALKQLQPSGNCAGRGRQHMNTRESQHGDGSVAASSKAREAACCGASAFTAQARMFASSTPGSTGIVVPVNHMNEGQGPTTHF